MDKKKNQYRCPSPCICHQHKTVGSLPEIFSANFDHQHPLISLLYHEVTQVCVTLSFSFNYISILLLTNARKVSSFLMKRDHPKYVYQLFWMSCKHHNVNLITQPHQITKWVHCVAGCMQKRYPSIIDANL